MRSPKDRLAEAIEAWRREEARERVARWRGDPDALSASDVHSRHARLRSAQARELLEEAEDRGELDEAEAAALRSALEEAHRAPRLAAARERERELWGSRAPYDSDHHAAHRLLARLPRDASEKRRRALGAALEPTLHEIAERRLELVVEGGPATPSPEAVEHAADTLAQTADAWMEVWQRLAHAARVSPEHWTDLAHALRADRWDDAVPARDRWRRLASGLGPLGFPGELARAVKVEARRAAPFEPSGELALLDARRDVRIGPGAELGAASERDSARALGRAIVASLAHPGLAPHLARPRPDGVGPALGALLAHLLADPAHLSRARGLAAKEARGLRELLVGLELFELRTAAAGVWLATDPEASDLTDRAREKLREAWAVEDVSPGLARTLALGPDARARHAALACAPRLFVTLRERFDVDFWRNPAATEPIRGAAARGATLGLRAWLDELEVEDVPSEARYAELL